MAGDIVVGVGNIYASEALFMAGLRPTLRADRISRPRAVRLHGAIVAVLQRALALGGSTLRDFSSAEGQTGYFQLDAMVYDREGLPCRVCAMPIKAVRQGQRSTFFCPACQPGPQTVMALDLELAIAQNDLVKVDGAARQGRGRAAWGGCGAGLGALQPPTLGHGGAGHYQPQRLTFAGLMGKSIDQCFLAIGKAGDDIGGCLDGF
mgnify:CR=1 FL=1